MLFGIFFILSGMFIIGAIFFCFIEEDLRTKRHIKFMLELEKLKINDKEK